MTENAHSSPAAPIPGGAWSAPWHPLRRMTGRSPREHRSATPLELLFDLAFVAAFGVAGSEMAHYLYEGHVASALGAFAFVIFAIVWAWINFTWFASAFDTDDWFYRVVTMVQMIGVVILALGIPAIFESIDAGEAVFGGANTLVAGYVVMRLAMVAQWLRVAKQAPIYRKTAMGYVATLVLAQVGWIVLVAANVSIPAMALGAVVLYGIELTGPVLAELRFEPTPWHPHHIAERYGLLTIIALGEGVLGTIAALQPIIAQGWTTDAIVLVSAGITLTFTMWWAYFTIPFGDALEAYGSSNFRGFFFGYGHILIYASLAAVGAGLHVLGYLVEAYAAGEEPHISEAQAIQSIVIPVGIYFAMLVTMYAVVMRRFQPFYFGLVAVALLALVAAQLMANAGVSFAVCVLVASLAPIVIVVGQEIRGHQLTLEHIEGLRQGADPS